MTLLYLHWFGLTFLTGSISIFTYTFIIRRLLLMRARKWDYLRVEFNKSLGGLIAQEHHFTSSGLNLQLVELKRKIDGSSLASQIMVEQIMTLRQNLGGHAPSMLDEIYASLGLHHFSVEKLKSSRSKIKAQGIHELTNISYDDAVREVETSKHADSKTFMSNTLIALAQKGKKDLSFIDAYRGELTHWMQTNIYHYLLEVDHTTVPDFSRWFNSSNISVALFAIKMSGTFRQKAAVPDLNALLSHPQTAIVESATAALDAMGCRPAPKMRPQS
jgi:hypothetical protein